VEEFQQAIEGLRTVDLRVTGRSSGRQSKRAVNFVQEGETLYLLPLGGSESNWYKNVLKTPAVQLTAHDAADETKASPIKDAAQVNDVVAKFRAKYGDQTIAQYYAKQNVAVQVRL
jgi:deazaflavin-dependent oxidoreductase (nitroreductase family)